MQFLLRLVHHGGEILHTLPPVSQVDVCEISSRSVNRGTNCRTVNKYQPLMLYFLPTFPSDNFLRAYGTDMFTCLYGYALRTDVAT